MPAHIINARNCNDALSEGLWWLKTTGRLTTSRNGPVLVAPGPVTTAYSKPWERVMWSAQRDANPFFHLFESIWMLAGRSDTAALKPLVPRMQDFSDDQHTLNGAYGYRWRNHFGYDQLLEIVQMLRKDPSTRRAVLSMWDGGHEEYECGTSALYSDLTNQGSKDLPCNTHIYFDASRGALDMTVCNRSNDVIWGAYGANSVHMSFLHEFIAVSAGLPMGMYYQVSNNYHIYIDRPDVQKLIQHHTESLRDPFSIQYWPDEGYGSGDPHCAASRQRVAVRPDKLFTLAEGQPGEFLAACEQFVDAWTVGPNIGLTGFSLLDFVLSPMMEAYVLHKNGDTQTAHNLLGHARSGGFASDWLQAAIEWLQRRIK